jgi:hypothetical protein
MSQPLSPIWSCCGATRRTPGTRSSAEDHARSALALLGGADKPILTAGAFGALAQSFLPRSRPDPEQAAAVAALDLQAGACPLTTDRAGRVWRELAGRWGDLPAVRDLGELVASARKSPPAGGVA